MKEIELRLVSELMKNSRRSDRELARTVGTSQPTVSRTIKKLEQEGVIKEYTMIPDFRKLGYKILALDFVKLKRTLEPEQIDKAREIAKERLKTGPLEVIMLEKGIGLGYEGVFISYHEDYSAHVKFVEWLKQFHFLQLTEVRSFLVNLEDKVRYRPLTLCGLANHVLQMKEKKK